MLQQADVVKRFAFRSRAVALLLAPSGDAPAPTPAADPRALRARLDATVRDPGALFAHACALPPAEVLRLHALLSPQPPT